MSEEQVKIQLMIVASFGERRFEKSVNLGDGLRIGEYTVIYPMDIQYALKRYVLRNCGDEEILEALIKDEYDRKMLVFNRNLSQETADDLVDKLCAIGNDGSYPYELGIILRNPCVSSQKLDQMANYFLSQYYLILEKDGVTDFDIIYLLRHIATNTAVLESTLETLKKSGIPIVVDAAGRII